MSVFTKHEFRSFAMSCLHFLFCFVHYAHTQRKNAIKLTINATILLDGILNFSSCLLSIIFPSRHSAFFFLVTFSRYSICLDIVFIFNISRIYSSIEVIIIVFTCSCYVFVYTQFSTIYRWRDFDLLPDFCHQSTDT